MKVHVLGGFLGAGKSTAIRALAEVLTARGERVAIVTNDQGVDLVDTAAARQVVEQVCEIGGGCFCCQYTDLEVALRTARECGATTVLAEAVGSCTDLIATVLSPLAERGPTDFQVAPLAVLVDPWRAQDMVSGAFDDDIRYLFEKQIQEADIVVLTHADLNPPDVCAYVDSLSPGVTAISVSGTAHTGINEWLATTPARMARPLDIDYDRYAAAEALLGWANARVEVRFPRLVSPRAVSQLFFEQLRDVQIAHIKINVAYPNGGWANLTRRGDAASFAFDDLPDQVNRMELLVNARVALAPGLLEQLLRDSMAAAAPGAEIAWSAFACFQPQRPVPIHRYSSRCDPSSDASCCATFYGEPVVQYLLGDSYHPGGIGLSMQLAERVELPADAHVLDVACGQGTSLRAIVDARPGVTAVGLDVAAPTKASSQNIQFTVGDAHQIPHAEGSFDTVLCECAVSTFADQSKAISEMYRVLRPGGYVGITDMLANGQLPLSMRQWVQIGTCLAHAHNLDGYGALLARAGFEVVVKEDMSWALLDMLKQIKFRLLTAAVAKSTGTLPAELEIDVRRGKEAVRMGRELVVEGVVGYGMVIARKPAVAVRGLCSGRE